MKNKKKGKEGEGRKGSQRHASLAHGPALRGPRQRHAAWLPLPLLLPLHRPQVPVQALAEGEEKVVGRVQLAHYGHRPPGHPAGAGQLRRSAPFFPSTGRATRSIGSRSASCGWTLAEHEGKGLAAWKQEPRGSKSRVEPRAAWNQEPRDRLSVCAPTQRVERVGLDHISLQPGRPTAAKHRAFPLA